MRKEGAHAAPWRSSQRLFLLGPTSDELLEALREKGIDAVRADPPAGDGSSPDAGVLLVLDRDGAVAERPPGTDGLVALDGVAAHRWPGLVEEALDRVLLGRRVDHLMAEVVASEARFRNTIERMADGVIVVDDDGGILFCNPAAESLFGREVQDLEGGAFGLPLLVGETTEVEILRPEGGARVAELRVAETAWSGQPALLVSLRDITDRREAEERRGRLLREQAARMEAESVTRRAELLAEASRDLASSLRLEAVLVTLASFLVEHVGDHVLLDVFREGESERIYRLQMAAGDVADESALVPSDVASSGCVDRARKEGRSVLLRDVTPGSLEETCPDTRQRALLDSLEPGSILVVPLDLGDAVSGAVTVVRTRARAPLEDADRTLVEETVRRAALAAENARLYALVQQASQAKSDFLAVISHELRTPLTGITGYGGLLMEGVGGELPEAALSYVDGILRNAESLLGLIDQILLFVSTDTDRQQVKYVEVSVDQILEDVSAVARPMAENEGLQLVVEPPAEMVSVVTDGRMVRQILLHLLANAVKFTREGTVRVDAALDGETLVFHVRDTGIGIPHDHIDDIFEPFRQMEDARTRSVGGTGLGLNVVRNLVHLLAGEILVDSTPGSGSTFTVRIPVGLGAGVGASEVDRV